MCSFTFLLTCSLSSILSNLQDFGISKKFVDEDGRHLLEGKRTSFGSGTPRFMSAYAHSHNIQSRRDDMESIGFMLMSFLMGELPWDRARGYDKPSYASEMVKIKEKLDLEVSLYKLAIYSLFCTSAHFFRSSFTEILRRIRAANTPIF